MRTVGIPSLRALLFLLLGFVLPLSALAQAPAITTPPASLSVASGSNASFTVSATGAALLKFQWRRFGTNLAGATNSTLSLSNVQPSVGGLYAVVITNSLGGVTSAPALLAVDEHLTFRILQLSTNGALSVEHGLETGDDRGGLVVAPTQVFVTGDESTARFSATDLSGGTALNLVYDSLCSNLRTEQIYLLGNGTNILGYGGGTVSSLIELDGLTGLPNGVIITLSTNFSFTGSPGIFSGYDRIVLMANPNFYDIALPSGRVTRIVQSLSFSRTSTESWAFWGLAEYFGNSLYINYVGSSAIQRLRIAAGSTPTPIAQFSNLGDMASIGFSVSRSRWFFHHEGTSQFRSGDETVGSAKAVFSLDPGLPGIYQEPVSQTNFPGDTAVFSVTALGSGTLTYQWRFNGTNLAGANGASLVLTNVPPAATGNYSVLVGNAAGTTLSREAFLFVVSVPQILSQPVSRFVVPGTNTTFTAVVRAAPPVTYQWRHEGTNILQGTNASYAIPFVTSLDGGAYDLLVTNLYGSATSSVAQLQLIVELPYSFKVLGLSNEAVIAEHRNLTGSDRGGVVVSSNRLFVTGDTTTGIFSADDLGSPAALPTLYDALVSDLRTGRVFALGVGTNLYVPFSSSSTTTLIELNASSGLRSTNLIQLSQPVPVSSSAGIFSGYGQIVLLSGGRAFSIAIPSGVVVDLGAMNTPARQSSEYWSAFWGLAENFGGAIYLVYVQNSTSIVRTRVPDGLTTSVANFINLSDMNGIGASVARGRWYFHHQGASEFGGTNETVGFAAASFSVGVNPVVDHFTWEPLPGGVFTGVPFPVTVSARSIDDSVLTNFEGQVALSAFTVANGLAVSVTPSVSGDFVQGVWTGELTIADPSAGLYLRASDFAGRFGVSSACAVVSSNDLAVQVVPGHSAPTLYDALTYAVILTNTGPDISSAVFVTNILPANVTFISASSSQGSCSFGGGTVVCEVGTMSPATGVTIGLTVVPTALGTLTNVTRVVRSAVEAHPENNSVTNTLPLTLPRITVTESAVLEGHSSTNRGTNIFYLQMNTTSAVPVTVQFGTVAGSATNVQDYVHRAGTLTFAPGLTETNVKVTIVSDRAYEPDEFFFLNFSNVANAVMVRTQAVGTILNDDIPPSLVFSNASFAEGNSNSVTFLIPVRLSVAPAVPTSVNWSTANGTALSGSDYNFNSGLLYYTNGQTNLNLSLTIRGDTVSESNEFLYLNFFNPSNVALGTQQMVVIILNDEPVTNLDHFAWSSIDPTQTLNMPFNVSVAARDYLNQPLTNYNRPVRLSAGADPTLGEHLLPPTETTNNFAGGPFTIGFAFTPSLDLYVTHVRHYSGVKVSIWTDAGTLLASQDVTSSDGTWVDTPLVPALKLVGGSTYRIGGFNGTSTNLWYYGNGLPATFKHGTIGTAYYNFGDLFPTTDLGNSLYLVDLNYALSLFSFSITPTNVTMTNGLWSGDLRVLTPGTNIQITASDVSNVVNTLSNPFDVLAVDDLELTVLPSVNPVPAAENLILSLIVSNTGPSTSSSVFLTNQLPAGAAYLDSFTEHGSITIVGGTLVADLGSLTNHEAALVSITLHPNAVGSLTNVAFVSRAEPELYLNNNRRTNFIAAVDLSVSVADVSVREGHVGTTNAVFAVSLSAVSTQTVSVAYVTTGNSAVAPADFASAAGLLIFAPGSTTQIVPVAVAGDRLNENNETFFLNLANATNAVLGRAQGVATIINDDPLPMLSVADTSVVEGRNGFSLATFTVTLNQPSGRTIFFDATTVDLEAEAGVDYVGLDVFVVLNPGQTSVLVTVPVQGDGELEPDEQFLLLLTNPSSATIAAAEARATILDDDLGAGFLDHFAWNIISSPQTLGRVFNVTLTARDGTDGLVPFSGTVALSARAGTNAVALEPATTAAFVNGLWSGALTFASSGTNIILTADDGAGHLGDSNPFDVNVANLVLSGSAPPEGLIEFPFDYVLTISNAGPSTATAVTVTNVLPVDVSFSGATPSVGACSFVNGVVRCDLGPLTNGGVASVSVLLTPWRGGILSNTASVTAFEFDPSAADNRATNLVSVTGDLDQDGLPDAWESQYGLSSSEPNDAGFDLDLDGHTSLQEYVAGTNPNLAASVFQAVLLVQGAAVEVRFLTVLDRFYFVERAPSPAGPWTAVGNELFGDGDAAIVSDLVGPSQHFYRVRVRH